MKYLPSILLLATSSVFADQFSYVEYNHTFSKLDPNINYDSNSFVASYEVDKHVAGSIGYEKWDASKNVTAVNTASGTSDDINVGLRGFSDFAHQATAYIEFKYHDRSYYGLKGVGLSEQFGIRFSPATLLRGLGINSSALSFFDPFRLGFFVGAQSITPKPKVTFSTLGQKNFPAADDKTGLAIDERIRGIELLYNLKQFTLGLEYAKNSIDYNFAYDLQNFDGSTVRMTPTINQKYNETKLYVQWHY